MAEASQSLVKDFKHPVPVLACHRHFLKDIGKDLLQDGRDKLHGRFRQTGLRGQLRTFARDLGRSLGGDIGAARVGLRQWQAEAAQGRRIPAGPTGIAVIRGMAQWILANPAEGNGQGFPFDLPWLGLYHRCLHASSAVESFLKNPPDDPKVGKALNRLRRILRPIKGDTPAFGPIAATLTLRAKLFDGLRHALFIEKRQQMDAARTLAELKDVRSAVDCLTRSLGARDESALRQRRSSSSSKKDTRAAIDIILTHIQSHGGFLWEHAIRLPKTSGGGLRLVDRTNNVLESYFHALKHRERRRSGRKILTQDFEYLPPTAALTANLNHADYV